MLPRLSEDWQALTQEQRKEYPVFGHESGSKKRKLGDEVVPTQETWKKNRTKLIRTAFDSVCRLILQVNMSR